MHLRSKPKICTSDISINRNRTVAFSFRCADKFAGGEVLEAISEDVRMGVSEDKGSELHDRDEAGEIHDFGVGIAAIENTR